VNDAPLIFLLCVFGFGGLLASLYLLDRSHKAQARLGEPSALRMGPPDPRRGRAIKGRAALLGIWFVPAALYVLARGGVNSVGEWIVVALILFVAVLVARTVKI